MKDFLSYLVFSLLFFLTASQLTGKVIYRSSPEYEEASLNANQLTLKEPLAIVYVQNTQDVINAIDYCKTTQKPLRVRNGRHSSEAYSNVDEGIVIDVSDLNTITFNEEDDTATVGAGNRLYDVYRACYDHGYYFVGGTCPSVGVTGFTLGGGFGPISRKFGLGSDQLVGATVVLANGSVVNCSKDSYSDLFWALRGAGFGNYGVVTSLTFKLHKLAPGNLLYGEVAWENTNSFPAFFEKWQRTAPYFEDDFTPELLYSGYDKSFFFLFIHLNSTEENLLKILEPIFNVTMPTSINIMEGQFLDAINFICGCRNISDCSSVAHQPLTEETVLWKKKSLFVKSPIPIEALQIFDDYYTGTIQPNFPLINLAFYSNTYGGAPNRIPKSDSAYVHRDSLLVLDPSIWFAPEYKDQALAWLNRVYEVIAPREGLQSYQNTVDGDLADEDYMARYYSDNTAELIRIKRAYDPENVFNYELSIPLSARPNCTTPRVFFNY